MNVQHSRILRSTLLAAFAFAVTAHAQPAGPPQMGDMKAMHDAMKQQRMEDLKTVLRLRPDQEPALAAFLAAQGPGRMGAPGHGPDHGPPKALSTPERLAEMAKHQAEMSARLEAHRQALTRFYAALTAEQQKVFDAAMRLQSGPHGGPDGPGPKIERRIIMHGGPGGPMPPHGAPH